MVYGYINPAWYGLWYINPAWYGLRYINPAWYGLWVYKSSLVWFMGLIQPGMVYGYINPVWYGLKYINSGGIYIIQPGMV